MFPASNGLTILFDVTNRCNIRCKMCHYSFDSIFHRRAEFMALDEYERIASEVLPAAHTVYLSAGSEPLLHPQFAEILEVTDRFGPIRKKALTNGLLLTPALDDAMIEFQLDELHVSIDGARAETYAAIRRGGQLARVIENLERLNARKQALGATWPRVQFNVTLMRSNLDELHEFVELAKRLGVECIASRHFMPYVGLDVEDEVTSHDPLAANEQFARHLECAARERVSITSFPDFYAVDGKPWLSPV